MMAYVHNRRDFPVAVVNHIVQPHMTDYIDIPNGIVSNKNVTITYDGLTKEDIQPVVESVETVKTEIEDVKTVAQKRGRKSRQNIQESE